VKHTAIFLVLLGLCNALFPAKMVTEFNRIAWLALNGIYFVLWLLFVVRNKLKGFYILVPVLFLGMFCELFVPIPSLAIRVFGVVVMALGAYMTRLKLPTDN
jgi:hypothetical protein